MWCPHQSFLKVSGETQRGAGGGVREGGSLSPPGDFNVQLGLRSTARTQGKAFLQNYFWLNIFTWDRWGHSAKGQVPNLECGFVALWLPGGNKRVRRFYQRSACASWLLCGLSYSNNNNRPISQKTSGKGETCHRMIPVTQLLWTQNLNH